MIDSVDNVVFVDMLSHIMVVLHRYCSHRIVKWADKVSCACSGDSSNASSAVPPSCSTQMGHFQRFFCCAQSAETSSKCKNLYFAAQPSTIYCADTEQQRIPLMIADAVPKT